MASGDQVVLVTGGAGFLGQHIVKHLMDRAPNVMEVRVFDLKLYKNMLGHTEDKPLKTIVGDLCCESNLRAAIRGVTTVIHTASMVAYCTFPNMQKIREINVEGTRRIVRLCQEENVLHLIYTSTVDVVIWKDDIIDGTEALPRLQRTIYPAYGDSKSEAEGLVTAANGIATANGQSLRTVALRPTVMYGEGDIYYVTDLMRTAKSLGGFMGVPTITGGKMQQSYVGNVAWAHVVAMETLSRDSNVGGHGYFVTDDTPVTNVAYFAKPFLERRGLSFSRMAIPGILIFITLWLLECLLRLIRPLKEINLKFDSNTILFQFHTYCFSRKRAETLLGYKPIYSVQEAMNNSMAFYSEVDL